LNNAWKFTRTTAVTRIEFGCRAAQAPWSYFIRDNGVGWGCPPEQAALLPQTLRPRSHEQRRQLLGLGCAPCS
jgi:light-regulated signal transduction histidine kinase (bacteriophytochrome)